MMKSSTGAQPGGRGSAPFGRIVRMLARVSLVCCLLSAVIACTRSRGLASPWADAQHDSVHGFQDALLDRFVGDWILRGTMAGGEVVHDITAEWVAGHQYLRFVELSREREDDGARAYEAIVLIGWDAEHCRYACLWLDSTGGSGLVNGIIGYAAPDAARLAFLFDFGGGTTFHTTFSYDPETDGWQWAMDSERDGSMRPFARAMMTRRD
ncbi:MAG: hypothetical protein H6811_04330 [Phycisphaeraceae bacterium]|nr:hypothetical protein [Phycisphaeraceae bacterium]